MKRESSVPINSHVEMLLKLIEYDASAYQNMKAELALLLKIDKLLSRIELAHATYPDTFRNYRTMRQALNRQTSHIKTMTRDVFGQASASQKKPSRTLSREAMYELVEYLSAQHKERGTRNHHEAAVSDADTLIRERCPHCKVKEPGRVHAEVRAKLKKEEADINETELADEQDMLERSAPCFIRLRKKNKAYSKQ